MPILKSLPNLIPKAWSATKAAIVASPLDEYAVASANTIVRGAGGFGSALSAPVLLAAGALLFISEGLFPRGLTSEEQEQQAIAAAEAELIARSKVGYPQVLEPEVVRFTGGQGVGISYIPSCNWGAGGRPEELAGTKIQVGGRVVTGAISDVACRVSPYSSSQNYYIIDVVHAANADGTGTTSYSFSYRANKDFAENDSYITIVRQDGQPDTDGNVPSIPGISTDSTSPRIPSVAVNPGSIVGSLKPGYRSVPSVPSPPQVINNYYHNSAPQIVEVSPSVTPSLPAPEVKPVPAAPDLVTSVAQASPSIVPVSVSQPVQVETDTNPSVAEPSTTVRYSLAGKTPITTTTQIDRYGITTTTVQVTATGKTVSIKRTVPDGVTVTQAGVSSGGIQRTANTNTFVIGTPTAAGIEIAPTVPQIDQAPAIPQVAGLGLTAAAVGAVVYGEQGMAALTSAAAAGTCQTTQPGGCMQSNIVDPLKAGQASLGELFNNVANTAIAAQNAAILAVVQSTNAIVAHSTYGLQAVQAFAANAWATTRISKVLNVINTFLILHNAAMLSSNLASSLGDIISSITNNTINLIKNEDGSNIDINQVLGSSIESFLSSILGAETYQNASEAFQKSSRILSSAANVANTIQFSLAGMAQGLETIGNYTGKIGNSLKKAGAVFENSYQWMSENLTVKTGRLGQIQAVIDGLEQVEQVASDLQSVTSEFKEVQTNVTQIGSEFNKVKAEVAAKETEKETAEETVKINSQGTQPSSADYTPDPLD